MNAFFAGFLLVAGAVLIAIGTAEGNAVLTSFGGGMMFSAGMAFESWMND